MLAKSLFQGVAVKPPQDGAQRVERRRSLQSAAEQSVENGPALLQEADDVAVRGRAGHRPKMAMATRNIPAAMSFALSFPGVIALDVLFACLNFPSGFSWAVSEKTVRHRPQAQHRLHTKIRRMSGKEELGQSLPARPVV